MARSCNEATRLVEQRGPLGGKDVENGLGRRKQHGICRAELRREEFPDEEERPHDYDHPRIGCAVGILASQRPEIQGFGQEYCDEKRHDRRHDSFSGQEHQDHEGGKQDVGKRDHGDAHGFLAMGVAGLGLCRFAQGARAQWSPLPSRWSRHRLPTLPIRIPRAPSCTPLHVVVMQDAIGVVVRENLPPVMRRTRIDFIALVHVEQLHELGAHFPEMRIE